MKKTILTLILSVSTISCGLLKDSKGDGDSASADQYGSSSIADVSPHAPGVMKDRTSTEAEAELKSIVDYFFSPEYDDGSEITEDSGNDDPMGQKFDQLKIEAQGNEAILKGDISLNLEEMVPPEQASLFERYNMRFRVLFHVICATTDLSRFNGMTISQTESNELNDDLCKDDAWIESRQEFSTIIDMAAEGREFKAQASMVMTGAGGGFCRLTKTENTIQTADGCTHIEKTAQESTGEEQVENEYNYIKWTSQGLTHTTSTSDKWYSAGKVDIQVANWKGDVTFNGGQQAPGYNLQFGDERITGTFDDLPDSFFLTSQKSLRKNLLKTIGRIGRAK